VVLLISQIENQRRRVTFYLPLVSAWPLKCPLRSYMF